MVVIRNVFQPEFGKTREAVALVKESLAIQKRALAASTFPRGCSPMSRCTLVLELTMASLRTFENAAPRAFAAVFLRAVVRPAYA